MRLNDDDKRVLAAIFHSVEPVGVSEKQIDAAGRTFKALGFTDESGSLTQRGKHVAKSLPFEKVKHGGVHGSKRKSVASGIGRADDFGDSRRARSQSGRVRGGSSWAAEERPDETGDSDCSDLPGADSGEITIPD